MALLYIDDFENFPLGRLDLQPSVSALSSFTAKHWSRNYSSVVTGSLSPKAVSLLQDGDSSFGFATYLTWRGSIIDRVVTVGAAVSASANGTNTPSSYSPMAATDRSIIRFSSDNLSALKINSDWSLSLGDLRTAANTMVDSVYSYIEIVINTSTGAFELFVNSVSCGTGVVAFAATKSLIFGGPNAKYLFYDDIYILDDTGTTHNQRLGPVRAVRVPFNSTTEANFTPFGAADNITAINKDSLITSTFNRSPASNNVGDYFKLDTSVLPSDQPIIAVQQSAMYRKTDIGERTLKLVAKEGVDRKEHLLPERLATFSGGPAQILETSADGSAWDLTNLAATDFGYETS